MTLRRLIQSVLLAVTALSIGCGGNSSAGTIAEIGTGTVDFESLDDNDALDLISGPQGGHHVIVHARAKNIIPGDASIPGLDANPRTIFQAFTEAGTQIDLQFPPYTLGYRRINADWFALPSGRILQIEEDVVAEIIGTRLRLTVQVTDAAGKSATDEVWIVVTEAQIPDNDAGVLDAGVDTGVDAAAPDAAN